MSVAAVVKEDLGWLPPAVLSTAVHLLLFLVLVFGVSWQSRPPEAVSVELWDRPPEPSVQPVQPPAPVPPKPELKPDPPPPKPAPKAVPQNRPDIALEKDRKAPPRKPPPKEQRLDLKFDPKEQLAREMQQLEREREKREALAQMKPVTPPASLPKGDPTYASRLIAKIRSNIILPPSIIGNPESIFDVEQLPTGEIIAVKLRKSSGNKSLDDALERAILKSSPLPRPQRDATPRQVEIKYRPLDP